MIEIYEKLCRFTQENMQRHNPDTEIHFELSSGLDYSIFSYPRETLLAIEYLECFIRECFYKILDRPVDEASFRNFLWALKKGKLSKEDFIQQLYDSAERKQKQTDLKI